MMQRIGQTACIDVDPMPDDDCILPLLTAESMWKSKGLVSVRGFSWILNILIIVWAQMATYRGHALLQTLNRTKPLVWCLLSI